MSLYLPPPLNIPTDITQRLMRQLLPMQPLYVGKPRFFNPIEPRAQYVLMVFPSALSSPASFFFGMTWSASLFNLSASASPSSCVLRTLPGIALRQALELRWCNTASRCVEVCPNLQTLWLVRGSLNSLTRPISTQNRLPMSLPSPARPPAAALQALPTVHS